MTDDEFDLEWFWRWLVVNIAHFELIARASKPMIKNCIGSHDAERLMGQIEYCELRANVRSSELATVFGNDCY